jgi:predicted enzyme related to lactoylglutathione lyase
MGAEQANPQGRIVWHDLNSTDVAASRKFYSGLFGWTFTVGHGFELICAADEPEVHFGTLMKQEAPGAPSMWLPYVTGPDIDAALSRAREAGGSVVVPKMPAGSTGFFAYVRDPQGAFFATWQYNEGQPKPDSEGPPPAGRFCWDELHTSDVAAASAFYSTVGGYNAERVQMPGMEYTLLLRKALRPDGKPYQAAGMMALQPGMPHPFWLPYVAVADCDASHARAVSLGATSTSPPMEIPNIGRFATFLDPTQAPIAILGPNR